MSVLDELDPETAAIVAEVVGRRAPELVARLESADDLSKDERERVETCLSDEFHSHPLGSDYEPSDQAKKVDDAVGKFLLRFPFERSPR